MKTIAMLAFPLLALVFSANASAQSLQNNNGQQRYGSSIHAQTAPISLFARYTFQPITQRTKQPWQVGLALSQPSNSDRTGLFSAQPENTQPVFELRFGTSAFEIWSAGSSGDLIADTGKVSGTLAGAEGSSAATTGIGRGIAIGGAILGGIILIAALSPDKKALSCTGNTVPNPIAGTCEPLR